MYDIYVSQAGGLTGATFGFVDVLRDPKVIAAKKSVATAKVVRFATLFGGYEINDICANSPP